MATEQDVHDLAQAMPHVTVVRGGGGNAVYQVGGKSFVFFRTPRPDAVDPDTGERYPDVIVLWVPDEQDKLALVQDTSTAIPRCSCGRAGWARSRGTSSPRWCRTPGSAARRDAGPTRGWAGDHTPIA
jgi:hypothetical protein